MNERTSANLRYEGPAPGDPAGPVDELLAEELRPEELRWYWAHMSLRMVDWAIRHYTPADVDEWITFAERRACD